MQSESQERNVGSQHYFIAVTRTPTNIERAGYLAHGYRGLSHVYFASCAWVQYHDDRRMQGKHFFTPWWIGSRDRGQYTEFWSVLKVYPNWPTSSSQVPLRVPTTSVTSWRASLWNMTPGGAFHIQAITVHELVVPFYKWRSKGSNRYSHTTPQWGKDCQRLLGFK